MNSILLHAGIFLSLAASASAEIIGVEQFDYPDGAIAGKNGGTFWDYKNFAPTGHAGTASTWDNFTGAPGVTASRLVTNNSSAIRQYNGTLESDGAVNDPASSPSSVAKSVYYRVTFTTGATLPSFIRISSSDFGADIVSFGTSLELDDKQFGYQIHPTNTFFTSVSALTPNTTYTVVAKLDYQNNLMSLFLNPVLNALEGSPTATPLLSPASFTQTNWSTAIRLASGAGGAVAWDDLVVATTWDELGTVVTTTADENGSDLTGNVSLREAVNHSPPGSLITFAPALSGQTITLGGTELLVTRSLTIDASSLPLGVTVDGNRASRLFQVNSDSALTLKSLILTGGQDEDGGGAIRASGTLTVLHCTLVGNTAGGYGGAIFNRAHLTLTGCTLTDNEAALGGGALSDDSGNEAFIISQCTIAGNRSESPERGGGMDFIGSTSATISHTILSGNTSGGVLKNYVTDLSGGPPPALVSAGHNLSDDAPSGLTASSDITNNASIKLSPPGYFGGPTMTMHPLIGSSAIDTGGTTNPGGTDQRGFPRFRDGDDSGMAQMDIGAVEAGETFRLDTAADPGGLRTLLNIAYAPGVSPGVRIIFNPATFAAVSPPAITLNGTELSVPTGESIFLDASNIPGGVTLSGDNASRVFNIASGATVAMHNLVITQGRIIDFDHGDPGAGIRNLGSLTMMRCNLFDNFTPLDGAAISNEGTAFAMIDCTLFNNSSSGGQGGALYDDGNGRASLVNCTFSGNSAPLGGAISLNSYGATLTHCTVSGNSAQDGGGLFLGGGAKLTHCIVAGNTVTDGSPDIWDFFGGGVTATGVNLLASLAGSGLDAGPNVIVGAPLLAPLGDYGGPTFTMPPFPGSPATDAATGSSRTTDQRGYARVGTPDLGAAESGFAVTTVNDSDAGSLRQVLLDAAALPNPGPDVIFFSSTLAGQTIVLASELTINDAPGVILDALNVPLLSLSGNNTTRVLRVLAGSNVTLHGLTIRGGRTTSGNSGGGILNAGTLTLRDCTITDCASAESSGAIQNDHPGLLTLERCTLSRNSAQAGGGAISHVSTNLLTLTACTVAHNTAGFEAGAINAPFNRPVTLAHCTITGNAVTNPGSNGVGGVRSDPGAPAGVLTVSDSIICGNTDANIPGFPNLRPAYHSLGNNLVDVDAQLSPLAPRGGPTETMPPLPGSPALDGALSAPTAGTDQRGFPRAVASTVGGSAIADIGAVERGPVVIVDTTSDSGAGSLLNVLAAVTAPDTRIQFDPLLSGQPITLSTQLDILTQNVELDATMLAAGLILQGNGNERVLRSDVCLAMHRVTVRNGNTSTSGGGGAGLLAFGTLLATDCTFTNNTGGGLTLSGVADLLRCTISGNTEFGGATITGVQTRASLTHCTVTGNTATTNNPGGLRNQQGTLRLRHCTISGNTGSGSSGGVFVSGTTSIERCIIAGNFHTGTGGQDIGKGIVSTVTALGPSLIGSNESVPTQFPAGPLVGTPGAPLDPLLAPLDHYGGPTMTMALRPESPARESAAGSGTLRDQRGFPIVDTPDIGAYEAGTLTNFNAFIWETLPATATVAQHGMGIDFDGDGQTNNNEWLALTHPGNPWSVFRLTDLTRTPGTDIYVIKFPSVLGRTYRLEACTDLISWGVVGSVPPTAGTGGQIIFIVTSLPQNAFFRVSVGP